MFDQTNQCHQIRSRITSPKSSLKTQVSCTQDVDALFQDSNGILVNKGLVHFYDCTQAFKNMVGENGFNALYQITSRPCFAVKNALSTMKGQL